MNIKGKVFILVILSLALLSDLCSQDLIYKKDKSVQKVKVIEVGVSIIKFKKYEILDGPTFEVAIKDVAKIKYYNGYQEIYDSTFSDSLHASILVQSNPDTSKFSLIYLVYNHGHNESNNFPCYFNEQYIWNIVGNRRLSYRIYSEGQLVIQRKGTSSTSGPSLKLNIQHGKSYYIFIEVLDQYAMDFNKRFQLRLVTDPKEQEKYRAYFNWRLSAFKEDTQHFTEDLSNPVIKK